ncbi:MAG: YbgC/FadM family acyl-CoA thioesterase [Pseudomonadota bacterium]
MNSYTVTVFLEDTDAGGIVYHSRYLNFMERCRTRFFYHKGIDHAQLIASHEGHFLVSHVTIDFKKPARLGDELTVTFDIVEIRGASIVCKHVIKTHEKVIAQATVIIVFINQQSGRPVRIPELIKNKIG